MTEPQRTTIAMPSFVVIIKGAVMAIALSLLVNMWQITGDIRPIQIVALILFFLAYIV